MNPYAAEIATELTRLQDLAGSLENYELAKEIILPSNTKHSPDHILYQLRQHNYPQVVADLLTCQCRMHLTGGTLTDTGPCPLCRAKAALLQEA